MSTQYFSEAVGGAAARVKTELPPNVWGGIVQLVRSRLNDGSFGADFPSECGDGRGVIGSDWEQFGLLLQAEVPGVEVPLHPGKQPPTLAALDLLQFCHSHIAAPIQEDLHTFFGHYHLGFDPDPGQTAFRNDVEALFRRNGIAYELRENGEIRRVPSMELGALLLPAVFHTGDAKADELLEAARNKYLSKDPAQRADAIEKIWDAWERVKTLDVPGDKKTSIKVLMEKASKVPEFRDLLNEEGTNLTDAGNMFHIRHAEVGQIPLESEDHQDYMFHRMFSLISLLLKQSGRMT